MERLTGSSSPSFACVGINARHPGTWTSLSLSRSAAVPSLSILCGILCAAYHLSRTYSTDTSTSLWALPPDASAAGSAMATAVDPPECIAGAAAGVRRSNAGARVFPEDSTGRQSRPGVRQRALGARPRLRLLAAHHGAAFACFAVDIAFSICLWIEVVHAAIVAVPHVSLLAVQPVVVLIVAGAKAWLVVGRFGRPWLAALGQMLWTVTPLRVTNPWTLRVAPRWGRHAAVAAGIMVNGLMLAGATAVPAAMSRGGGYPWRISWRPLLVLWVLYAMHAALMRLTFWTHARVALAPVEGPHSAAGKFEAQGVAEVEMAAPAGSGTLEE